VTYRLAFRRYALPFRTPVRTAHGIWPAREGFIVRLERESGSEGYGEIAPIPSFGTETVDEAENALRDLGSQTSEEQLAAVPEKFGCVRFALAAARGAFDQPAVHTYLPVAALLPAGRTALAKINADVEAGFRTFKWKVGVDDIADELGLLDDLVAQLPAGARLRLDANGAWDRRRAERWLERCADRPIEFVEQPIAPDARGSGDLLRGLANDYPTPLALDESVTHARDVERWTKDGWPGFFVIKPTLLGDASQALAQLRAAKARVVFSSALETAVGARNALQIAFAWSDEPRALGFGVWPLFENRDFDGPASAPFIRAEDVQRLNAEAVWTALA
jgi:o-succinylbenzoate synthase